MNNPTIPVPATETLYRAALTFCLDGADAMMYATLKGADSAETLWHTLAQSHPGQPSEICTPALTRINRMFVDGIIRWGRTVSPQARESFHDALAHWHNRMEDLPSQNIIQLADWFTMDGTQWIIGPGHPCWPNQLADLSIRSDWAPPLCLWGKGDPRALVSCPKPIGIVGSRDVNEYGRYVAHTIAEQAATDGHLVVSGGAIGTDAAAHWGALNAMHGRDCTSVGRTAAVFAGGLNHMGPARNRTLFERIEAQGGALISELCPGTIPEARRFLLRNRIIAALSSTLIVAQARLRSGALNTAGWACELMHEVYAVPGDINQPCNAGCNRMISDHRAMILCAATSTEDICHERHEPLLDGECQQAAAAPSGSRESAGTASGGAAPNSTAPNGTAPGTNTNTNTTGMAETSGAHGMAEHSHTQQATPPDSASTKRSTLVEADTDTTAAVPATATEASATAATAEATTEATTAPTTAAKATATAASTSAAKQDRRFPASRHMPDLRDSLTPVPPPIKVSALPEMQRMMIGLIRECRGRHLLVTPDALLHVARETAPDEIPNIGSVLGLLGALELNGVVEREAGVLKLSDRLV